MCPERYEKPATSLAKVGEAGKAFSTKKSPFVLTLNFRTLEAPISNFVAQRKRKRMGRQSQTGVAPKDP